MAMQDDTSNDVRLTRRFLGRFVPPEGPRNIDHAQGFENALIAALDAADRSTLNVAGTFQARVTFEAEIEVGSPGNVGEYRAIVGEI